MSIREQRFGPYRGTLTPARRKPLVIARYALGRLFDSRLFVAFFLICYIPALALAGAIYGYARVELMITPFIEIPEITTKLDAWLLSAALSISLSVSFLVVLVVGPALIAPDLANNAMPLYLSRGLRKRDYVLGKLLALFLVAGAATWVPCALLVLLSAEQALHQSWLAGVRLALALTATTLVWTSCLAMIAFALSAWVKTRPAATLGFLGLFVVADVIGDVLDTTFGGWVGSALDPSDAIDTVGQALYNMAGIAATPDQSVPPTWAAWAVLLLCTAAPAAALARRIRAGELAT